ncbi:MAG: hypothetical protein ACKPKO_04005, partial [Candidatus Fonsibacter sp.]
YGTLIMEETTDKSLLKKKHRLARTNSIAQSAALGYGSAIKKRHTRPKKRNDANYVLSKKFEIN